MIRQLLLVSFLLLSCAPDNPQNRSPIYLLTDGSSIDLASPGKLLVINYWATWCAPCRHEIPELNQLNKEYSEQIAVLGVNFDTPDPDQLQAEISKLGIEFVNLHKDPRQIWGLEPATVLPETLIISSEGELLHRLLGPQTLESLEVLL